MDIAVCGLSHRSATIDMLERLAFPPEKRALALAHLTSQDAASTAPSITEAVILSTCNRVELYVALDGCGDEVGAAAEFLAAFHGVPLADIAPSLYTYRGLEAAQHLFRVAAGIDSVVLGEPQILGQVRQAFEERALRERPAGCSRRSSARPCRRASACTAKPGSAGTSPRSARRPSRLQPASSAI